MSEHFWLYETCKHIRCHLNKKCINWSAKQRFKISNLKFSRVLDVFSNNSSLFLAGFMHDTKSFCMPLGRFLTGFQGSEKLPLSHPLSSVMFIEVWCTVLYHRGRVYGRISKKLERKWVNQCTSSGISMPLPSRENRISSLPWTPDLPQQVCLHVSSHVWRQQIFVKCDRITCSWNIHGFNAVLQMMLSLYFTQPYSWYPDKQIDLTTIQIQVLELRNLAVYFTTDPLYKCAFNSVIKTRPVQSLIAYRSYHTCQELTTSSFIS